VLESNKLCLGTAKIGMPDYGFSDGNKLDDPVYFLSKSIELGVGFIDTSPRYGNSEELVGQALKNVTNKPFVSTKIDNLISGSYKTPDHMLSSIEDSIRKMSVKPEVCYLHQNQIEIISDKYVHEGIRLLKDNKLINSIGTSVYSKEELMYTLDCGIFDWIQIPVNITDTSFYNEILEHGSDIKISVRSVFLQGIMLNSSWARQAVFKSKALIAMLRNINEVCLRNGISIQELSVSYLSLLGRVNQIIIGTTSIDKLKDNIASTKINVNEEVLSYIDGISSTPKMWTNPRNW